jgi:uncharacterized protein YkwD
MPCIPVLFFALFFLATAAQAGSPESLGVFDATARRFSLFQDLRDGKPDITFDLARDSRRGLGRLFPISGDWDGDGVTDLGYYASAQHVFVLFSDRKDGVPDIVVPVRTWRPWLRPVVGDWNGDGRDDLGLWDPLARRFSLLGPERDGRVARTIQVSDRRSGVLQPFAGDWDGDGVDELGLYDAHERTILLLRSKATGDREIVLRSDETAPHLKPVAIDLDGDGKDELALFDRASKRFALLTDLSDGRTDGYFDASAVAGEHLRAISGRWTAAPASGGDVPNTALCLPVASVDPAWKAFEDQVVDLVNARRAAGALCGQEGSFPPVPPVAAEPTLRCAARLHARDMAARGVVSSVGAGGSTPDTRIAASGYAASFVGENVAGALPDPTAVVDAWMANSIQCSLVLEPGFQHAGVGFVDAPAAQRFFWVLDFGAPQ